MASPSVDPDVEAQPPGANLAPTRVITNSANPQLPIGTDSQPQATNTNEPMPNWNPPVPNSTCSPHVQRDENHGNSPGGLCTYLTEAEKKDTELNESGKGDTGGILEFTGLLPATVASFIIERYHKLSPNSGDTTNALLTQLSQELVKNSNGTPLTSVVTGHCVVAMIIHKLAVDFESSTLPFNDGTLSCLSTILGTESHELEFLVHQPGALALVSLISLAFGEVGTLVTDAAPPDVLDVIQQTLDTLYQAPLAQEIAEIQLGQYMAKANDSHGKFESILVSRLLYFFNTCVRAPSHLTLIEEMRTNCLRICLKHLWCFGRASNQLGNSVSLLSPMYIPFSDPELIRRICEQHDPAVRVIGRCVGALVASKLASHIDSRTAPVSHEEEACLSAILGTEGHNVRLLLRKSGAVALANIISLVFDEAGTWITDTIPSDALDVVQTVQETLSTLLQALPAQKPAEVHLEQTVAIFSGSDGKFEHILVSRLLDFLDTCLRATSALTEEVRSSCQRMCLKGLWYFQRAFIQLENSRTLPSSICVIFTNHPEIFPRVRMHRDLTTRELGRCVGALLVNKLAADLRLRTDSNRDVELGTLSGILGTGTNHVALLLRHRGAIEFTNIFFLALADVKSAKMPLDVLDVVQHTFGIISQAFPTDLNANIRLVEQTDTLRNVPDGISPPKPDIYKRFLHACWKNVWNVVTASNEPGNLVPLPSYIRVAFTSSAMNWRIQDADLPTGVIGRCVQALVINKLTADINAYNVPVSDEDLACLSAILRTASDEVMLWFWQPGAIELGGIVTLVADIFNSLVIKEVSLDVLDVVQDTLDLISQALLAERIVQLKLDQPVSLLRTSNRSFERIASNLETFLQACIENTSPLTRKVRTSCLRICLKSLWCFTRWDHRLDSPPPLPSYFPLVLASPKITQLIRTETDPAARVTGRCFEALVVDKLVTNTNSSTDEDVACLSAILDQECHIVWRCLDQRSPIDLRNVISIISDEIDTFVADELPADVLEIFQQTLSIISRRIDRGRKIVDDELYMDQVELFHNICSIVADRGGPEWLKYRLEGILLHLPEVKDRNRDDLILDEQSSDDDDADDISLKSISDY